jgi:molybdate transport repressor ModE-like protein
MSTHRIELRQLAHFVAACQNPTISETARALAVTPSALSSGLRSLETELQLALFARRGGYLAPLPAGFWLFRRALDVLHAEARLVLALDLEPREHRRIMVRLDLSFTMGRITRAVHQAVDAMAREAPLVEFLPIFLDSIDAPADGAEGTPAEAETVVAIGYMSDAAPRPRDLVLHDDAWLSVGTAKPAGSPGPLVVLDMRPALVDAISGHAARHGFAARLRRQDDHPADLANLVSREPQARFLLPRSMIADRLGLVRLHQERIAPDFASRLVGRVQGPDEAVGRRFLEHLRDALGREQPNVLFSPRLTTRQIQYFNLIQRAGGVSAAARQARVTQPSMSSQVMKMEAALGRRLFERRRGGATATAAGRALLPHTTLVEERLDAMARRARDIAAHTQATVSLGTLPSSGHDSALTARIAEALTRIRLEHPDWRLHVIEASNATLHESVRAGQLNLAVVGAPLSHLGRITLGRSERLSLIANPALGLEGRREITLADVCALPLVLGPRELSIHQLFLEAVRSRRLPVSPVMEVGSLPLAIAMVRRAPICTVLPLSSVQQDVQDGRLTATAIAEDVITGKLSVIFSPERTLSVAERAIVTALVAVFGKPAP